MSRLISSPQRHFAAAALLGLSLFAPAAVAEVSLPNVFSDHMVLQRRQANRVWGRASPGEKVVVTLGTQSHNATAGADGAWQVTLSPLEAGAPVKLVAKGSTNEVAVDLSSTVGSEAWNSRDLKSRPH